MKREDRIVGYLDEIRAGSLTLQEVATRSPSFHCELEPLVQVELKLTALPKTIALSEPTKARIRAQLMAEMREPAPAGRVQTWLLSWQEFGHRLLQPQGRGHLIIRPIGVAVALFLSFSLLGVGTVFAAMDSLPGDGLYPIKTATEQARLALALTSAEKADAYLWMASSRVKELSKMAESNRFDLIAKVAAEYQHSYGEAFRFASSPEQSETNFHQQAVAIQTDLREIYQKAPQDFQAILAVTLSVTSPGNTATSQSQVGTPPPNADGTGHEATAANGSGPVTSALPQGDGGKMPTDKSGVVAEPTPGKTSPISSQPPEVGVSDKLPPKGDIGPAPGPVTSRDTAPTGGSPSDNTKTEPVSNPASATPSDTVPPKTGNDETDNSLDDVATARSGAIQGAVDRLPPVNGGDPTKR